MTNTLQRILRIPSPAVSPAVPPAVPKYGFGDPANILLTSESAADWQEHLARYLESFAPATQPETELVLQIASIMWRLSRLLAAETGMLNRSKTVPASHYQAIATFQAAYQIAVDCLSKLSGLTKVPPSPAVPGQQPDSTPPSAGNNGGGGKVVVLVKQPQPPPRRVGPVSGAGGR